MLDAGQLTNYQGKVVLAKVNEANDALANAIFSLYTEARRRSRERLNN